MNPSALTRREFLAASIAATAATTQSAQSEPPRYNVVVLIVDEHNPRYSALENHELAETPNLRRMMARGTVFERCYCPSPLCAPSGKQLASIG